MKRSATKGQTYLWLGLIAFLIGSLAACQSGDQTTITIDKAGSTLSLTDGALLTFPPEGISEAVQLETRVVSAAEFQAEAGPDKIDLPPGAAQLPPTLSLKSPVYRFEIEGTPPEIAIFSIPVPDTKETRQTLDLYAWDGAQWQWSPAYLDSATNQIVAQLAPLPKAVALMQTSPEAPLITALTEPDVPAPPAVQSVLTELLVTGFYLQADGHLETAPSLSSEHTGVMIVPSLRNWRDDGQITADVNEVLSDPGQRQRHIDAIVGLALIGEHPAVQIDYRELNPNQREDFSVFVTDLAGALEEQKRKLLVRVESPTQVSASRWETGAYDWPTISRVARLQVPLPVDPAVLTADQIDTFLRWVVGQANRSKIQPIISLTSLDTTAGKLESITVQQALSELGPLRTNLDSDQVVSGEQVALTLANVASGILEVEPEVGLIHYMGPDSTGQTRQFYLNTSHSLSRWLQRLNPYHLAGVALEGLFDPSLGQETKAALEAFRAQTAPVTPNEVVWVWTVTEAGSLADVLSRETQPLSKVNYLWSAPDASGTYQLEAALSPDGGNSTIPVASLALRVKQASAVANMSDSPNPGEEQQDNLAAATATRRPTSTPRATATPMATPTQAALPPPPSAVRAYQLAYTKYDGRYHNLFIADFSSQREQLLLTRAAGPSFSPDKKRLFFFGEQGVDQQIRGGDRVACGFGTISEGIVALDLPSPVQDICQIQFDAWFCERKTVDLQSEPSDVCTANGFSVYQNLDWKDGSARWASTSPAGDAVAYDARPGGDYRIYFRAMLGTSQQFRFEIPGEHGSWSPDGNRVVYRSGRNNQVGLWISNRDDSNPIRITDNGTDAFPTWSPDGRTIAFSREVGGNVEIHTVNVDDSNLQRLTDAEGPDSLPVYTPAGQIVFRSARSGGWGIWIMNGDGTGQEVIIPNAPVGPEWAYSRMDVR